MKGLNSIVLKGQKLLHKASKHSPEIMLVAGIAGVVAGVVTACVKTPEAKQIIDEAKAEINDIKEIEEIESPKKEIAKTYVRTIGKVSMVYLVPAVILVLSIGSIIGAHNIQSTRYNQLAAAYITLDQTLKNYRKEVAENLGEDEEKKIFGKSQAKAVSKDVEFSPASYGRWLVKGENEHWNEIMDKDNFESYLIHVVQTQLNNTLQARGHLFLNEVYKALGLEQTAAGQQVGWIYDGDGDGYVNFELTSVDEHGRELEEIFINFNVDGPIIDKVGWKTI